MGSSRESKKKEIRYQDNKKILEGQQSQGFDFSDLKLTDEMKKRQFRFTEPKLYRLAIIPYVAGKFNPSCDEGFATYTFSYQIHKNVGSKNKRRVCNKKTWDDQCYGCDWLSSYYKKNGFSKEIGQQLGPKQQSLFNVLDFDDDERIVRWFQSPFYMSFPEMLFNKLESDSRRKGGGRYQNFWHLDEGGCTLEIEVQTKKYEGRDFLKVINIDLIPREEALDEDLIEQAFCLDEMVARKEYEDLKDEWEEGIEGKEEEKEDEDEDQEDEDEDESKSSKNLPETSDEEDEEESDSEGVKVGDFVIYEGEECEVKKVSPDGTSLTLQDQDGKVYKAVGPDEVEKVSTQDDKNEEEEEDEEVEEADQEDSEEENEEEDLFEEEEEDEEESPPPPKKKSKKQ